MAGNTVDSGRDIELGSRVVDKHNRAVPGEEVSEMVVVGVHPDVRADEYTVSNGEVLSEIADKWPPGVWDVDIPDGYDPDADSVIEVVFLQSLDNTFLGAWVEWEPDKLRRLCEKNDVTIYSYHKERLELLE